MDKTAIMSLAMINNLKSMLRTQIVLKTCSRQLSASATFEMRKRKCKTVRTMAWFREAARRQHREFNMKVMPKSDQQILEEERIAYQQPIVDLLPTERPQAGYTLYIKPEVMLSEDNQTIIFYHPPPKSFPIELSKPLSLSADNQLNKWWAPTEDSIAGYPKEITDEQITEAKNLRESNPILWTMKALTHLLQVHPDAIHPHIMLSPARRLEINAESQLIAGLTRGQRRRVREKQLWDRVSYVQKTRGSEASKRYRQLMQPLDLRYKRTPLAPRAPHTDRIAPPIRMLPIKHRPK